MRRIFILFALFPLLGNADELTKGKKDTIFIGEIKVQQSVIDLARKQSRESELQRVVDSLDSQFISSLGATRVFQLVERKRKGDIELEQKFSAVAVDPNDKNIAQGAKMAGAKFAFLPQIDGFEDRTSSSTKTYSFIKKSVTSTSRSLYLSAIVQVVDTTTGTLLPDSPSIQADSSSVPAGLSGDRLLVELAKAAASKLSFGLISLLRPAKVLDVTGNQILINRGVESFPVDTQIEFYAVKEVKDEDTGETFRNELPVGKAKIVRGDAKQSFAIISGENLGIAPGCVARPLKAAAPKKEVTKVGFKKQAKVATERRDKNENDW